MPKTITKQDYKEKWEQLKIPMNDGETAVQMEIGGGKYFLTNQGRVFSMAKYGTEWREMKYWTSESPNIKRISTTNKQLRVDLYDQGDIHRMRISKLISQYFKIEAFNPFNEEQLQVHHKVRWNPEDGTLNNRVENLQKVGAKAHTIISAIQKGTLEEDGLECKNTRSVWKKIGETPAPAGYANMYISKINPDTKEVVSTEGKQVPVEEVKKLLNKVQVGIITEDDKYKKKLEKEEAEARKLIDSGEASGKVRIVDGHLQLIKEKKGTEA